MCLASADNQRPARQYQQQLKFEGPRGQRLLQQLALELGQSEAAPLNPKAAPAEPRPQQQ